MTSVDPYWLAEYGSKFYSVREQNFNERQKRALDQQYKNTSEAEMTMREEFAAAQRATDERKRAERSVTATPRIAGVGTTPVARRTPRRVGL